MRMEMVAGARGVTILNDCYNANPLSTDSALMLLAEFPGATRMLHQPSWRSEWLSPAVLRGE